MPKKYVAKLNGVEVGKRKTERTYTNAVVVVHDLAAERAHIERPAAEYANDQEARNYRFEAWVAVGEPGVERRYPPDYSFAFDAEKIAEAAARVVGGYDGWLAAKRARYIETYAKRYGDKAEHIEVATWCGRPDLAQKEANKWRGERWVKAVHIVPAELA